ncbi:MAG: DUF3450 family protein [Verrucomicrobiales bacterium]|nr:DUF3450 family protein [Verrucomicrobiales bacterium]
MIRLLPLVLCCLTVSFAQEDDGPAVAREKVVQWISTKKTIAEESAKWQEEKAMLVDLIELREREAGQMDEIINEAKERVSDIENKTSSLKKEETDRKAWRSQFARRVSALEDELKAKLPYLPPPVKSKMFDAVERLESSGDEDDLQARFRDILALLNECISFNSQITSLPEIHEIDGNKVEVDVIYLGMKQAWYVDRTNKYAAIGVPTKDGWVWRADSSMAGKVRRAIDVHSKKEPPAFVELPILGGGAAK